MKKFILTSTILAAMALSSCSVSINGEKLDWDFEEKKSESVSISSEKAAKLDIDIKVGQIDIRYGDTKNVEVIGSYTSKGVSEDKVSAALENVRLESEIKGDTLSISVTEPDFDTRFVDITTDLDITLPSEFSDFTIQTDVGDIDCDDLSITDDSSIKADVGDIDISLESVSECDLEITADVGDIDIDTQGLDFTEKDKSEDFVGKKKEIVIDDKCTVKLTADVGTVKVKK